MNGGSVRIDKWLWAVRLYKTRTLAAEACRAGHVQISGQHVKPAHGLKVGEVISAKVGVIIKTVKVAGLIDRRVGAKVAKDYLEDQTPESEYAKLKDPALQPPVWPVKGWGRPTKKNRRALDQLFGG